MSLIITGLWAHALYGTCGYAIEPVKPREARRALARSTDFGGELVVFSITEAADRATPLALTLSGCSRDFTPLFLGSDVPEGIEDLPLPPIEILMKEPLAEKPLSYPPCVVDLFRGRPETGLWRLMFEGPRSQWPDIFVTSPEYQFLQAAQRWDAPQAALVGASLCGQYRARPDYPEGCCGPESPLMSKASAARFIDAWPDKDEAERARAVLAITPENARLSAVAASTLLFCLPEDQGGYAIDWPELSAPLALTPEAEAVLDHGGTKDEAAEAMGTRVIHMGPQDFESVEALDRLVQRVTEDGRMSAGRPDPDKQRELLRTVTGPHWWW